MSDDTPTTEDVRDGYGWSVGGIFDYPEFNFPAFERARAELEEAGFTVLCPTDNELDNPTPGTAQSFDWYLRRDLRMVVASDGIALLPGFEASRGAHLELDVAHALGIATLPVHMWMPAVAGFSTDTPEERSTK